MNPTVRACPICGHSTNKGPAFPFATRFNHQVFNYMKCSDCDTVFVDPVPDTDTFTRMYAKAEYHDCFYEDNVPDDRYTEAASLLQYYAPVGAVVLDYGCGLGGFLKAVRAAGFQPFGVEFDDEAANGAAQNAQCKTVTVDAFWAGTEQPLFDVIHLGDVLEHLPDPARTLAQLLVRLKPGGVLFAEGPLEINPSPVYWAANVFGLFKRMLKPASVGQTAPTHLFRTGARQQLQFFTRVEPTLAVEHWEIYETGWPYASGGVVKSLISRAAIAVGGKRIGGMTFGNRFTGIFRYAGKA